MEGGGGWKKKKWWFWECGGGLVEVEVEPLKFVAGGFWVGALGVASGQQGSIDHTDHGERDRGDGRSAEGW